MSSAYLPVQLGWGNSSAVETFSADSDEVSVLEHESLLLVNFRSRFEVCVVDLRPEAHKNKTVAERSICLSSVRGHRSHRGVRGRPPSQPLKLAPRSTRAKRDQHTFKQNLRASNSSFHAS